MNQAVAHFEFARSSAAKGAAETHRAEITPVLGSHKGFFIPISVPEGIRVAGHQAGEIK